MKLTEKVIKCLKSKKSQKCTANEISIWIWENYNEYCLEKMRNTKAKTKEDVIKQIAAEIGRSRSELESKYNVISITDKRPYSYYMLENLDVNASNREEKIVRNKIWFGAPGTGKSYKLNKETKNFLGEEKFETNHERVTFHPDYSYANFVGTYKPIMTKVESKDNISYKYVPGPFMRVLVRALNNPKQNFVLIIEEINRANTAAVFGDIFQLLDRNPEGNSEYPIAVSEDIKHYLEDVNLNGDAKKKLKACTELIIPSNMYIWATMNSADQGVFPMDTAFKRRWDFEYMDINAGEAEIADFEFDTINWNNIRKAINDALAEQKINEDKLMGAYFLSKSLLESKDNKQFVSAFKSKVLMYLYEDAAKMKRDQIFFAAGKRYSEICKKFDTDGIQVFNNDIQNKYKELKSQSDEQNKE
ncbi:MAG: AAA family ATPase [Synergistaceae bacterium]|nr:AAA family ATPase [Candidatus Equadaptatus faecalis]